MNADRARELLIYDPDTGVFVRRVNSYRKSDAGLPAGHSHGASGYVTFNLAGKRYFAHRLAWLYMHGTWPMHQIDHIDGDRSNNRISNLRDVTPVQNSQNLKRARRGTKTGFLGVTWNSEARKFQSQIRVLGQARYLGVFDTAALAHEAYLAAKRTHHPANTL